jgi:predicted nucleic acid-binding protein
MGDKAFLDTNILVCARDKGAGQKHLAAEALLRDLWETRRGRVSIQVLNEYFVTVTRKLKPGLSPREAWADVVSLQAWAPIIMDGRLLERGQLLFRQHNLSWWDALVVAAAQAADCDLLYSEDLGAGRAYDGVRIVNPFTIKPA